MTAKELMLDDFVKTNDGLIVKVHAFARHGLIFLDESGCKHYVHMDFVEPIPLTPEILQKNSFEWYYGNGLVTFWSGFGKDNEDDIEIDFFTETDSIKIKVDMHGHYYRSDSIRTVHKLQHIIHEFEIPINIKFESLI